MNRNIYRLLKILHLIGLSLFLGSIFGHIVASVLGGAPEAGAVLIALLAFFVIVPAGVEMLRLAQQGVAEHAGQIKATHKVENMVGATNILLAVLATALGVVKPKWGKRQRGK